jgi:FkbM family methyltransferase
MKCCEAPSTFTRCELQHTECAYYIGPTMSLRLRYLYRAYRYRYRVDPAEIRFMGERLRRGDLAVDIGAFKGAYTYWMQRFVGKGGQVIAFEPQPRQAAYLRKVLAAMKYANVTLEAMGVSDAVGTLRMFVPASGHEATFESRKAEEQACQTVDVPVTTLDAYFAERAVGPAFVKIDVEGHESAVLAGARETLARFRPTLLVECEARHRADGDVRPVIEGLTSLGYESSIFLHGQRLPITEFDFERHQHYTPGKRLPAGYVNNFAFEHPDRT